MKKLTKKQRKEIYLQVYKRSLNKDWWRNCFICNNITNISKIPQSDIFNYFPEFNLLTPINYDLRGTYPFCVSEYNPETKGNGYTSEEFQIIQQDILSFCIAMCEE